jgi:ABC-type polysaccharide/polyol phosphate export permease
MPNPSNSAAHVVEFDQGSLSKTRERWHRACVDIVQGLAHWRLWWLLGLNDIRQRYRRSKVGQFWITLSMGAFIFGAGFVFGQLFQRSMAEYLPFLTVSMVVWGFMTGILNDSCTVFAQSESYLRQERLAKSVFVMRLLVRNLLIFVHNLILIPVVFLIFGKTPSATALLAIPGLILVIVNTMLAALFLAMICTRFRDLPQIVGNLLQIAFFVSPVMWEKNQILAQYHWLVDLNPLATHLTIITDPLLGRVPTLEQYATCLAITVLAAAVALPFFARFRERIVYWL